MNEFTKERALVDWCLADDRVPIYLVDAADAGERFQCGGTCYGFTGVALDLALRPLLLEHGRWGGRGFACIINTQMLAADRHNTVLTSDGIALHELGHFLTSTRGSEAAWQAAAPDARRDVEMAINQQDWSFRTPDEEPSRIRPRWSLHELPFIRASIHVEARARELQPSLHSAQIQYAGSPYGLSPAATYQEALGDEISRLRAVSIRDILATPAPASFQELWKRDTQS